MAWFKREDQKLPVGEQVNRVPEGLWIKCTGCREIIYRKDVLQNASVCPKCAFHFRITARERLELLFDGPYEEFDRELASADPLKFKDTKAYASRLKDGQEKTGGKDALVSASGKLDGRDVLICAMEYGFIGGSMGVVVGEKITRAAERAISTRAPLIVVSCSGGARMMEGCLLYTSPSPRDRTRSRMPSSA